MRRLEALADCIGHLNNFHDPSSDAYRLRNPGLVRAFTFRHLHSTDERGRRRFSSLIGGYRFLICDLTLKCSGKSRAKERRKDDGSKLRLKPTSALADLLNAYGLWRPEQVFEGADFLNKALRSESIGADTPLSFFLEESSDGSD